MTRESKILEGMETIVETILDSNTALTFAQTQHLSGLSHCTLMANMVSQQQQQAALNSAIAMAEVRNLINPDIVEVLGRHCDKLHVLAADMKADMASKKEDFQF